MNLNELADRYVAVWNERDSEKRKRQVAELWIPQGEHYVESRKVVGHDALELRIIESHNEFVRDAGNRFRASPALAGKATWWHSIGRCCQPTRIPCWAKAWNSLSSRMLER